MHCTMRAKLRVDSVTKTQHNETIEASAVSSGTPEDNSYAKATPHARLTMTINNPSLIGVVNPGDEFYVDFHKVPDKPADAAPASE